MTVDEAFALLGLDPNADTKAVKRAYHKLLRRTKPEHDPVAFRRLREAFETATAFVAMEAFREQAASPESSTTPSEPSSRSQVDPEVVWSALERGELEWAHALVMDDRWADAMLDEPYGPLQWTTREVGLRVILVHRPAFDALAAKYPGVFTSHDERLAYLLRIGAEWSQVAEPLSLPVEFAAFISSLGGDDLLRRRSARALGQWFHRDVRASLTVLRDLMEWSPEIASVLEGNAMAFAREFDDVAPDRVPPPHHALRPLTAFTNSGALVSAIALSVFGHGNLGFRIAVGAALFVFFHVAEDHLYGAIPSLRRRFLRACIRAGIDPHRAAAKLQRHPFIKTALLEDDVLALAFHVGRLAQLELDR